MKKTLYLAACFAATFGPATVDCLGAPVFNPENGHYYEAIYGNLSWLSARDAAAASSYFSVSGHLVSITAASENNFVFGSVYSIAFTNFPSLTGKGDWVWLGGFQPPGSPEPDGGWSWVTGEPFGYSKWDSGQPSDSGGNPGGNHQDFLLMWYQGFWNDATGGLGGGPISGYIVEYEVVPEPTIWGLLWVGTFALVATGANRPK